MPDYSYRRLSLLGRRDVCTKGPCVVDIVPRVRASGSVRDIGQLSCHRFHPSGYREHYGADTMALQLVSVRLRRVPG